MQIDKVRTGKVGSEYANMSAFIVPTSFPAGASFFMKGAKDSIGETGPWVGADHLRDLFGA